MSIAILSFGLCCDYDQSVNWGPFKQSFGVIIRQSNCFF